MDEASSAGSIKLLTYVSSPRVVEISCVDDMYPAFPRPPTVDVILDKAMPPGPNAEEKEEIDSPIKFVVEIKEDVNESVEI